MAAVAHHKVITGPSKAKIAFFQLPRSISRWPKSHSTNTVQSDPACKPRDIIEVLERGMGRKGRKGRKGFIGRIVDRIKKALGMGHIVKLEWRTEPLYGQIPIRWCADFLHLLSVQKLCAERKDVPASRDSLHSCIYLSVKIHPFKVKVLRCQFGADQTGAGYNLEIGFLDQTEHPKGQVQQRWKLSHVDIWSCVPFLQRWESKTYMANPFMKANCNQFARDFMLELEGRTFRCWIPWMGFKWNPCKSSLHH